MPLVAHQSGRTYMSGDQWDSGVCPMVFLDSPIVTLISPFWE